MSLKAAHIVFVVTAITFSLAGARWAQLAFEQSHIPYLQVVAKASVAMALILLVYGVWFYRKLQKNPAL